MTTITHNDTDIPSPALCAYWESPEFKTYLAAKRDWEDAHAAYERCVIDGDDKEDVRNYLIACANEARRTLAICRELPIHSEAFGW